MGDGYDVDTDEMQRFIKTVRDELDEVTGLIQQFQADNQRVAPPGSEPASRSFVHAAAEQMNEFGQAANKNVQQATEQLQQVTEAQRAYARTEHANQMRS